MENRPSDTRLVTYINDRGDIRTRPANVRAPDGYIAIGAFADPGQRFERQRWPIMPLNPTEEDKSRAAMMPPERRPDVFERDVSLAYPVGGFTNRNYFTRPEAHNAFEKSFQNKRDRIVNGVDYLRSDGRVVRAPENDAFRAESSPMTPMAHLTDPDGSFSDLYYRSFRSKVPTSEPDLVNHALNAIRGENYRAYSVPGQRDPRGSFQSSNAPMDHDSGAAYVPLSSAGGYNHPGGHDSEAGYVPAPEIVDGIPGNHDSEAAYTPYEEPRPLIVRARRLPVSPATSAPTTASATQKAATSAPTTAARSGPAATSPAEGFFSKLFADPYAGMTSKQMFEMHQRMGDNTGATQLYMRAAAKQAEEARAARTLAERVAENKREEVPLPPERPAEFGGSPPRDNLTEQKARGGAASGKGGKDAALLKALEIIHNMMTRG